MAACLLALLLGGTAVAGVQDGAGGRGRSLQQIFLGNSGQTVQQLQQQQEQALLLLKSSLGSSQALANWQSNTNPCQFSGVACNGQGLVTGM